MTAFIIVLACVGYFFMTIVVGVRSYKRARHLCGCEGRGRHYCGWAGNMDISPEQAHGTAAVAKGLVWPVTLLVWTAIAATHLTPSEITEKRLEREHQQQMAVERRKTKIAQERAKQAKALNRELRAHGHDDL